MLADVEGRRAWFAIPQNLRSYLAINFSNDYYALSHELPIFCPKNAIYASTMAFFCEKICVSHFFFILSRCQFNIEL